MPENAETIIDFECVPTYSQTLFAQIIDMDGPSRMAVLSFHRQV